MAREKPSRTGGNDPAPTSPAREAPPVEKPSPAPAVSERSSPPAGLKELPTREEMEKVLADGWEKQVAEREGRWINRRDFNISGGGVVPQGVIRSTEEAYNLEVRRLG